MGFSPTLAVGAIRQANRGAQRERLFKNFCRLRVRRGERALTA
jgi:hypothetical protein